MIPELHIARDGAVPAEAPWADSEAARRPSRQVRPVLLGLALLAAAILFAASNDRLTRFVEARVAAWTIDPAVTAKAAKKQAIARLIAATESDAVLPAAEGADAVARPVHIAEAFGEYLTDGVYAIGSGVEVYCPLNSRTRIIYG